MASAAMGDAITAFGEVCAELSQQLAGQAKLMARVADIIAALNPSDLASLGALRARGGSRRRRAAGRLPRACTPH